MPETTIQALCEWSVCMQIQALEELSIPHKVGWVEGIRCPLPLINNSFLHPHPRSSTG